MALATPDEVLEFWFTEPMASKQFAKDDAIDALITEKFGDTYEAAVRGELDDWKSAPRSALALIIVLDQFPRNMFRGSPRSFEADAKACEVTHDTLDQGFDRQVGSNECTFFYMPLMHSENLHDQNRCVEIFEALGKKENLRYAIDHRDIIARFGRFPHRNAVMGRDTTPEEAEFLKEHSGF